jgi:hypothetical protein
VARYDLVRRGFDLKSYFEGTRPLRAGWGSVCTERHAWRNVRVGSFREQWWSDRQEVNIGGSADALKTRRIDDTQKEKLHG